MTVLVLRTVKIAVSNPRLVKIVLGKLTTKEGGRVSKTLESAEALHQCSGSVSV